MIFEMALRFIRPATAISLRNELVKQILNFADGFR